ncbi:phage integrase [Photobacterium damselae]|uniref:phage integrase n=1 Tax=Photobacterium damselae TaxID=38293 RepID=UPI0040697275
MSIKSIPNGYEVDCRPQGRNGKRYRKKFKTKGEAVQFERWLIASRNQKDWVETPKDRRPLSYLIDEWFRLYGQQLKDGESDVLRLKRLDRDLGHPKAYQVTKRLFVDYRAQKLLEGQAVTTLNRIHWRLSGIFTALIEAGEYHGVHPLKDLKQLKVPSREMSFLSKDEIRLLLSSLDGDALKIAKLCLSTGARWSEAANLKGSNIANNRVTFVNTKNGKNRTVPISDELFNEIYTGKSGLLFKPCYHIFYSTLKRLNLGLPSGQASHVMRHTFASHFMMNGGNILTLQKVLGHSSVLQTMTYAHLAPEYLSEAIKYNPLTTL